MGDLQLETHHKIGLREAQKSNALESTRVCMHLTNKIALLRPKNARGDRPLSSDQSAAVESAPSEAINFNNRHAYAVQLTPPKFHDALPRAWCIFSKNLWMRVLWSHRAEKDILQNRMIEATKLQMIGSSENRTVELSLSHAINKA